VQLYTILIGWKLHFYIQPILIFHTSALHVTAFLGPPTSCPEMPQIALVQRNVFVYDASIAPMVLVAGCHQFGHFTNAEFYFCVSLCFQQPHLGNFRLLGDDQNILPMDGAILPAGQYYVISSSFIPPSFAYTANRCSGPSSICLRYVNSRISPPSYYLRFVDAVNTQSHALLTCRN